MTHKNSNPKHYQSYILFKTIRHQDAVDRLVNDLMKYNVGIEEQLTSRGWRKGIILTSINAHDLHLAIIRCKGARCVANTTPIEMVSMFSTK